MIQVETVLGPVDVADLDATLMHEHVFVLSTEILQNYGGAWWDEEHRVADAIAKLRTLRDKGVRTIVDPTVIGLGRYVPRIQRINEQVDINIVVATGIYTFDEIPFYFHYRGPGTILGGDEVMTQMFVDDIRDGIGETGVKAAFLKCCVEERGLTAGVERVARAVAQAHVETGVPITVHTNAHAQSGRLAVQVFEEEGVDMTKVVVGHSGDTNDLDYLRELMGSGATIGMDRFGLDLFNPTADRVATIAALCGEGYVDRMVLSHDAACFMDFFSGDAHQRALAAAVPNWHYNHIPDDVLPALRGAGVTDEQIHTMLVENPRRYFSPGEGEL
ncbi:MAG: phosphotriesterase-related protein [Actinomycetota bacterium]|nr:phosphotriesterase-related protein [Candidatus Dormibacteraeota bacterium]MDQ6946577.1 phosphotriesterase-related protein [Actinomycetota bacterium]